MTTPTLDGKAIAGFFTATHNATALSLTTASNNDIIVVVTSAEPDTGSDINVSGIANTGTAVLIWHKYQAFNWISTPSTDTGTIEVWYASAASAGTYDITVTYNATVDNGVVCAFGVNGAVSFDTGTYKTATGSGTNPAVAGITSTGGSLFIVAADSGGANSMSFGAAPSNLTTTILEQLQELSGSAFNALGTYYGTSSGAISGQTITTNDTHTGGWGTKVWGMLVFALTSVNPSVSTTITTSLGQFEQVIDAAPSTPAGVTTHLGQFAQVFDVRDAVIAAITTQFSGLAQVFDVVPRQIGNTSFNSWWSIGP